MFFIWLTEYNLTSLPKKQTNKIQESFVIDLRYIHLPF